MFREAGRYQRKIKREIAGLEIWADLEENAPRQDNEDSEEMLKNRGVAVILSAFF